LANGNDWQTALGDGGQGALFGGGLGLMTGTVSGYKYANQNNQHWWTGKSLTPNNPNGFNYQVPEDWVPSLSKKGGGIIYKDPNNPHNSMRVMPGNPSSPNPAQQNPYVIYKSNGVSFDVNGSPLPNSQNQNTHIPLSLFNLNKMP